MLVKLKSSVVKANVLDIAKPNFPENDVRRLVACLSFEMREFHDPIKADFCSILGRYIVVNNGAVFSEDEYEIVGL